VVDYLLLPAMEAPCEQAEVFRINVLHDFLYLITTRLEQASPLRLLQNSAQMLHRLHTNSPTCPCNEFSQAAGSAPGASG
jgi:hypothetical protein